MFNTPQLSFNNPWLILTAKIAPPITVDNRKLTVYQIAEQNTYPRKTTAKINYHIQFKQHISEKY